MGSVKKLRALVLAESCNPEWISVPLVGWFHCEALHRLTEPLEAHIVTQVRNRDAFVRQGWREGTDFTAIDSEAVARPMAQFDQTLRRVTGLGWTVTSALGALPYAYFEHLVWKTFGSAIKARQWDVVHRVTSLSPTTPSVIAGACRRAGVPFVWGPINGGVAWPPGFGDQLRAEGEYLSYVRDAYKLLPFYRSTRKNAAAIIVGSRATLEQVSPAYRDRCVYVPENAVDPVRFGRTVEGPVRSPLRVAFVGRLVPYKGADMLLEAAAPLVRAGRVQIDIIGDGPQMGDLRRIVEQEKIGAGVKLNGWVENTKLQERLVQSDVLGFPSIREFGGAVVMEAMALGLVPVVADYAGPSEIVTDATGYRIPMGSRTELVGRFREALGSLASDPSGIREMGKRARERVFKVFTWDEKARQSLEVYRWVTGQRDKPDFGMPFPD
jgi:glycosyltransferase involved in cell wall biosynthesis